MKSKPKKSFLTLPRSALKNPAFVEQIAYLVLERKGDAEAVVEAYKKLTPGRRRELGTFAGYLVSALVFELEARAASLRGVRRTSSFGGPLLEHGKRKQIKPAKRVKVSRKSKKRGSR